MRVSGKFSYVPVDFYYTKPYKLTVTYTATHEDIEEVEVFVDDGEKWDVWELLSADLQVQITDEIMSDYKGTLIDSVEGRR